ncbi:hypothetical protein [Mycolicibacterium celeriflavum]|uniref:hypothetical protein n=1 Tax=Mycolicibacterium celeriflavum TaxID=1249101 RepID=UPI003CF79E0C
MLTAALSAFSLFSVNPMNASVQVRIGARYFSSRPIIPPTATLGMTAAYSCWNSQVPLAAMESINRSIDALRSASIPATRRGVKTRDTSLRSAVCLGGSM